MNSDGAKRKLCAIFSADVKGYSRLMGEDEEATVKTIKQYRIIMASIIGEYRGRVVDSPGDNLLAEFPSVVDAAEAAVTIQKELKAKNAELPENRRMEFRIGINLGDVIEEGDSIYGDGVNVAARIEGLADAGGICISRTVFDQVKNKLDIGYEYLGDRTAKNIADPVRVYRILMEPDVAGKVIGEKKRLTNWMYVAIAILIILAGGIAGNHYFRRPLKSQKAAIEERVPSSLPDKPSIAVLPFTNMSKDPEQEYFSDGLTEDLITDLSKISGLFVIARNSAFTYKGKSIKINQVARELNVRYILEGSVRQSNNRVRITAQLIDAATGYHLWAERYDRELKEIFSLQDAVTLQIVTALKVHLTDVEEERLEFKATDNTTAYDLVLKAREYRKEFYTKEGNLIRRRMCEKAIELDPGYADAYTWLGWTYFSEWSLGWNRDPKVLDRAFELAERSLELKGDSSMAYILMAQVHLWRKEHNKAISKLIETVKLYPNDAWVYGSLASTLVWSGMPNRALSILEQAIRLDPRSELRYWEIKMQAFVLLDDFEKSIELAKKIIAKQKEHLVAYIFLAIVYAELDRLDEARKAVAMIKAINPAYTLEVAGRTVPYKDQSILERQGKALEKAGLK